MDYSVSDLQAMAAGAANTYGVPTGLFNALISGESSWNTNAISNTGALGLGQVLPSTYASPGYGLAGGSNPSNLFDPGTNLNFSASYLSALYSRVGSWAGAIQRYTGGQAPASTVAAANVADAGFGGQVSEGSSGGYSCPAWLPSFLCDQNAGNNPTPDSGNSTDDPFFGFGKGGVWDRLGSLFEQGAFVVLGILLLIVGVWMLKDNGA